MVFSHQEANHPPRAKPHNLMPLKWQHSSFPPHQRCNLSQPSGCNLLSVKARPLGRAFSSPAKQAMERRLGCCAPQTSQGDDGFKPRVNDPRLRPRTSPPPEGRLETQASHLPPGLLNERTSLCLLASHSFSDGWCQLIPPCRCCWSPPAPSLRAAYRLAVFTPFWFP